jgi:hypothetical protein
MVDAGSAPSAGSSSPADWLSFATAGVEDAVVVAVSSGGAMIGGSVSFDAEGPPVRAPGGCCMTTEHFGELFGRDAHLANAQLFLKVSAAGSQRVEAEEAWRTVGNCNNSKSLGSLATLEDDNDERWNARTSHSCNWRIRAVYRSGTKSPKSRLGAGR